MFGPHDPRPTGNRPRARLTVVGAENRSAPRAALSVLYVEDDEDDVFLMRRHLAQSLKYAVDLVHVPSVAGARLAVDNRRFDVVLCDFWLGAETTVPLIDALKGGAGPALVLVSSLENEDIELIGRRAGAAGFVAKDDLSATALDRIFTTLLPEAAAAAAGDVGDLKQAGGVGPWLRALMRTLDRVGATVETLGSAAESDVVRRVLDDLEAAGPVLRGDVIDRLADLERASQHGGPMRFDAVPYLTDAVASLAVRTAEPGAVHFTAPTLPIPLEANPAIFSDLVHGFLAEAVEPVRAGRSVTVTPQVADGRLRLAIEGHGPVAAPSAGDPEAARVRAAAEARRLLVETLAEAAGGRCRFTVEAGSPDGPGAVLEVPLRLARG